MSKSWNQTRVTETLGIEYSICLDARGAGWGSRELMLPFLIRPLGPKRAHSHRNTVSSQRVNIVVPQAAFP
jgi:hypothetical protein